MHPALRINEIVSLIARSLTDTSDEQAHQSLNAMALACQAFLEPAMDVSWRTVRSARRLVQIFPADVVFDRANQLAHEPDSEQFTILRDPSETEWSRFDYYAKRVRSLAWTVHQVEHGAEDRYRYESEDEDEERDQRASVSPKPFLIDIMKIRYGESPAFRNLKTLVYNRCSIPEFKHWTLFAQSQLATIMLEDASCLSESLTMTNGETFRAISTHVPSIKTIVSLAVSALSPNIIKTLAEIPTLCRLSLDVDSGMDPLQLQSLTSTSTFPSLKVLHITTSGMSSRGDLVYDCAIPTAFLRCISSPTLHSIEIDCRGPSAPALDALLALFSTIVTFRDTLTSCKVYLSPYDDPIQSSDPISLRALVRALQTIGRSLKVLSLPLLPLLLGAEDLFDILNSCNNLRTLHLGEYHGLTYSTINIRELLRVRDTAPRLRHLGIRVANSVDVHAALDSTDIKRDDESAHKLSDLCLGYNEEDAAGLFLDTETEEFARKCFPFATVTAITPLLPLPEL